MKFKFSPAKRTVPPLKIDASPREESWESWFREIAWRRQSLAKARRERLIFSFPDPEEGKKPIVRPGAQPEKIGRLSQYRLIRKALSQNLGLEAIRTGWNEAAGRELARYTRVHSFKDGILTIAVDTALLVQEIRQFHRAAILDRLRLLWPASVPLLRIKYKLLPKPRETGGGGDWSGGAGDG